MPAPLNPLSREQHLLADSLLRRASADLVELANLAGPALGSDYRDKLTRFLRKMDTTIAQPLRRAHAAQGYPDPVYPRPRIPV